MTGEQCEGINFLSCYVRRTQVQWRAGQNSDPSTQTIASLEQVTWCSIVRNATARESGPRYRLPNLHCLNSASHGESNPRTLAGLKICP
mmetsp:Transcript_6848/g.41770  ORF Transcript_6848/g.41770 Transcript_6848/m.41770 type:complete len:89 (+) Transcript_6848:46-312(+)